MKKLSKLLPKKKNQPLVVAVVLLVIIFIIAAVLLSKDMKMRNKRNNNNNNNNSNNNLKMPLVNNNNLPINNILSESEVKMNNEVINNMTRNDTALEYDDDLDNTESNLCNSAFNFIHRLKENPEDYEKFKKTSFYSPDFDSLYYLNKDAFRNICLEEVKNSFPKDIQLSNEEHDDLINGLIYCLDNSSIDTLEECLKDKIIGKMLDIQLRIQGVNSVSNEEKEKAKNMIFDELKKEMSKNVKNNMKNNVVVIENKSLIVENNVNNKNKGNNYNNNSIHFKRVNHTFHNNDNIDQLSKNMYRMESQRESNNNSINDYLRNHNL